MLGSFSFRGFRLEAIYIPPVQTTFSSRRAAGFARVRMYELVFPVQLAFQNRGARKDHDSYRIEHQGISGCLGPASAHILVPDHELTETADDDVFSPYQCLLENFQKVFNQ